jgi:hypothetical protein
VLAGLGLAAATPLLPWSIARGGTTPAPRRLVLFYTPHGTIHDAWVPANAATFELGRILSPLAPFRDRIVQIDGLRIHAEESIGAPHTKGPVLLWTADGLEDGPRLFMRDDYYFGWNLGPSVDQVIADSLEGTTRLRSLEVGVLSGIGFPGHRMIYRAPSRPLGPLQRPEDTFRRVFGPSSSGAERIRTRRRSVLHSVAGDLAAVSGRVSADDRAKIEAHAAAIEDIERALDASACAPPVLDLSGDPGANLELPRTLDLQMQLVARALRCDATRVASIQVSVAENDGLVYPWVDVEEGHHQITHRTDAPSVEQLTRIYEWYATRFAALLGHLDAIPEDGGTVLDHTMVVWGSELGAGATHSFDRVPFVVAGGGIAGGRYLDAAGASHSRLLVSMAHWMGLTGIDRFGGLDPSTGPLAGLV